MQLNSTVFSKSTNKDTSRSSWPAMTATWSWYVPLKILQRVPISLYIPQQIIDIKKKNYWKAYSIQHDKILWLYIMQTNAIFS